MSRLSVAYDDYMAWRSTPYLQMPKGTLRQTDPVTIPASPEHRRQCGEALAKGVREAIDLGRVHQHPVHVRIDLRFASLPATMERVWDVLQPVATLPELYREGDCDRGWRRLAYGCLAGAAVGGCLVASLGGAVGMGVGIALGAIGAAVFLYNNVRRHPPVPTVVSQTTIQIDLQRVPLVNIGRWACPGRADVTRVLINDAADDAGRLFWHWDAEGLGDPVSRPFDEIPELLLREPSPPAQQQRRL